MEHFSYATVTAAYKSTSLCFDIACRSCGGVQWGGVGGGWEPGLACIGELKLEKSQFPGYGGYCFRWGYER